MQLPFTAGQFLDVMARYNAAVWPMPVALYLVAAWMVFQGARSPSGADRWVLVLLAFLWAWMGIAYHWIFFTTINAAAWAFGAFFVVQAALFLVADRRGERFSFRFARDGYGVTGAAFLLYALVLYPVLGALAGHAYPDGPTFGLPCPTTIATFGILLWATGPVPGWLLAIPAIWTLVGSSAAFRLGVPEDYGLLVAGVAGTVMILVRNRRLRSPPRPRPVPAA